MTIFALVATFLTLLNLFFTSHWWYVVPPLLLWAIFVAGHFYDAVYLAPLRQREHELRARLASTAAPSVRRPP